jgi:hypothetical protein
MIRNSLGGVLSPGGLAAAERSEGSVCEPERSAAAAKVGAGAVPVLPPDSEVVAKAKRRVSSMIPAQHGQALPGRISSTAKALIRYDFLVRLAIVDGRRLDIPQSAPFLSTQVLKRCGLARKLEFLQYSHWKAFGRRWQSG